MSKQRGAPCPVPRNLDTTYVNLAALIRYLQQRGFSGRVSVELDEYDADVFLSAGEPPRVRETNHATGRVEGGADALQRLLVRASDPGGLIYIYEDKAEEVEESLRASAPVDSTGAVVTEDEGEEPGATAENDLQDVVRLSADVIATVERAALSARADFARLFRDVRLSLADDYSFLDPSAGRFEYSNGVVRLIRAQPGMNAYVSGVSEAMRRVVDKIAQGSRAASVRERVALELAVLARRRQPQLAKFKFMQQLDRIAGTRVL